MKMNVFRPFRTVRRSEYLTAGKHSLFSFFGLRTNVMSLGYLLVTLVSQRLRGVILKHVFGWVRRESAYIFVPFAG